MNIHHKNMKQVSQDMQAWTESHFSGLDIYELNYSYYDIKNKQWMVMPCIYGWYCEFMEKDLDLLIAPRLQPGWRFWDKADITYQNYEQHLKNMGIKTPYKSELVSSGQDSFEMFVAGSTKPLAKYEQQQLERYFKQISHIAQKVRKSKPHVMLDFRGADEVQQLKSSNHDTSYIYKKSHFKGLTLTAKEQLYIEYLLFHLSHKEIAYKQKCSQTAVRKVICNIKRKLGQESMPTSKMLYMLNEHGVLNTCSHNFQCN